MDKFESIRIFFENDIKIKEIMYNSSPDNFMDYVEASNKLNEALNDIEFYFKQYFQVSDNSYASEEIHKIINSLKEKLAMCTNMDSLKKFYVENISNMRPEFVDDLNNNCFAYYLFSGFDSSKCQTINELLHLYHHRLVNNEHTFQSLEPIGNKVCNNREPITVYGTHTYLADSLLLDIDPSIGLGMTDILSINENKIIMLIRDLGHALSIEIEKENDKYFVKYFFPKVTNYIMANELPGVRPVKIGDNFATGEFITDYDNLFPLLNEFLKMVPTDLDLDKEGGKFYIATHEQEKAL